MLRGTDDLHIFWQISQTTFTTTFYKEILQEILMIVLIQSVFEVINGFGSLKDLTLIAVWSIISVFHILLSSIHNYVKGLGGFIDSLVYLNSVTDITTLIWNTLLTTTTDFIPFHTL